MAHTYTDRSFRTIPHNDRMHWTMKRSDEVRKYEPYDDQIVFRAVPLNRNLYAMMLPYTRTHIIMIIFVGSVLISLDSLSYTILSESIHYFVWTFHLLRQMVLRSLCMCIVFLLLLLLLLLLLMPALFVKNQNFIAFFEIIFCGNRIHKHPTIEKVKDAG